MVLDAELNSLSAWLGFLELSIPVIKFDKYREEDEGGEENALVFDDSKKAKKDFSLMMGLILGGKRFNICLGASTFSCFHCCL